MTPGRFFLVLGLGGFACAAAFFLLRGAREHSTSHLILGGALAGCSINYATALRILSTRALSWALYIGLFVCLGALASILHHESQRAR